MQDLDPTISVNSMIWVVEPISLHSELKKLGQEIKDIVFNDSNYRLLSNDDAITLKEMRTFNKKDANNLSLYNDFAYKK